MGKSFHWILRIVALAGIPVTLLTALVFDIELSRLIYGKADLMGLVVEIASLTGLAVLIPRCTGACDLKPRPRDSSVLSSIFWR